MASKTEFVYIQGKVKWFRHISPESYEGETPRWKHTIYPNAESLEKIRELQSEGIKNVLKKDDDGYYITFGRPTQLKKRDGSSAALLPPEVTDKDGNLMKNTMVGNGSDVTTKLEVYGFRNRPGKAARWLASRIDTLVPFEQKDMTAVEQKTVSGLPEQPAQTF